MKTEFEKMRNEEFYDFTSEECLASYFRAKHICTKLQTMTVEDEAFYFHCALEGDKLDCIAANPTVALSAVTKLP